jgi:hypothetical protein
MKMVDGMVVGRKALDRGPAERGPGLGFQTGPRGAGPCTTVIP